MGCTRDWTNKRRERTAGTYQLTMGFPSLDFFYTHDSTYMSKVEIRTLRSFLLIEQCAGPSS